MSRAIEESRLSTKYAQAFLNTFWQELQPVSFDALKDAELFFKKHKEACFLMRLSIIDPLVKRKALQKIRINLGLTEPFDKIIKLLIDHNRSSLLEHFFRVLKEETSERLNIVNFRVTSVGALEDSQKEKIVSFLKQSTGKTVFCSYQEDSKLIAGMRLQSDQFLWENSIESRLKHIRYLLKR